MFPTCKNSQKRVKNQKSTDKHSSFDGLIQEHIDLSDIYLAVNTISTRSEINKQPNISKKLTKIAHFCQVKNDQRFF